MEAAARIAFNYSASHQPPIQSRPRCARAHPRPTHHPNPPPHHHPEPPQLADFDPGEALACIKALLHVDRAWLPAREGYSMYIRPFAFSSGACAGRAHPAHSR